MMRQFVGMIGCGLLAILVPESGLTQQKPGVDIKIVNYDGLKKAVRTSAARSWSSISGGSSDRLAKKDFRIWSRCTRSMARMGWSLSPSAWMN